MHHRLAAALMHLSLLPFALLERGMVAWIIPLVLWLMLRGKSPLIDHHGRHAVNWGIWLAMFSLLLWGLAWLRPGNAQGEVALLLVIGVVWGVVAIRRAWRAWRGRDLSQKAFTWFG